MKRKIILSLMLLASFSFGMGPGNRPGMGMRGEPGFPFIDRFILKDIGVDENVIKEILDMTIEIRKQIFDLQSEVRKNQLDLQLELDKPNYDRKKINDLIRSIVDLRAKQQYIIESRKFRILEKLTPEQRKKLFEYIENRRKLFWGRVMKGIENTPPTEEKSE